MVSLISDEIGDFYLLNFKERDENMYKIDSYGTGLKIYTLRTERNYSVAEVAYAMGFNNPTTIYKWENGTTIPTVPHLLNLAHFFGVSMDDIIAYKYVDEDAA